MEENFTLTNIGWKLRAGWYKEIDLSDTYTAVPRGYLMWDIYDFPIEFEDAIMFASVPFSLLTDLNCGNFL